ncbi:MAG: hypothetical protein LBT46_04950 [Planctomycetaceae bacterium]|nr:hypothetical protein [Planctomycetaceae bacterium]
MRYQNITLLLVLLLIFGCREAGLRGLYTVKGKITHQGTPLEGVTVSMEPINRAAGSRGASGISAADGQFVMTTLKPKDGVYPGEYKITLAKTFLPVDSQALYEVQEYFPDFKIGAINIIPEKYHRFDTTDVQFTVKAGRNEMLLIDMTEPLIEVKPLAPNVLETKRRQIEAIKKKRGIK